MNLIVTMAGGGRRFREAGYEVPKHAIEVRGRSLLAWALASLRRFIDAGWSPIFVARREHRAGGGIAAACRELAVERFEIVELDAPTDGQATTALAAGAAVRDAAAPVAIYNIDTYVEPRHLAPGAARGDGWIPCFDAPGDAWSFAVADRDGRVREVREKQRVSPHATIGLYWFSSFDLLRDSYERHYADPGNLEAGERYVAPLYNRLIAAGRAVYAHHVPPAAVHPLGTPADVERFREARPCLAR